MLPQPLASLSRLPGGRRTWALIAWVGVLLVASLAVFVSHDSPRGLARALPLPRWFESWTQNDAVNYRIHVALGTALDFVGAPPVAVASEWFKASYHAHTYPEIVAAARGLSAVEWRIGAERLEAVLCPGLNDWSDQTSWGARGRQSAVLTMAHLACGDDSTFFGTVPDDMPIQYTTNPPVEGIYHETWYPNYGVAPQPVPPAEWVHNLAHGEIVLLYRCPQGCADILAQAANLQATLSPGRNPRGPGGARLIVTAYDGLETPLAVVSWGHLLTLQQFDADQIAAFYEEHVDQGIECRNFVC